MSINAMKSRLANSFFGSGCDEGQPADDPLFPADSTSFMVDETIKKKKQASASLAEQAESREAPIYTTPVDANKRRTTSKIPQPISPQPPKKGILKRPLQQNYAEQYVQPTGEPYLQDSKRPSILERFMMIQALVDTPQPPQPNDARGANVASMRPTVEFSERNAVTIYGDTSDENLTEAHEPQHPSVNNLIEYVSNEELANTSKHAITPQLRQSSTFFSEDSEESSETAAAGFRHQVLQDRSAAMRPSPLTYSVAHLKTIDERGDAQSIILSCSPNEIDNQRPLSSAAGADPFVAAADLAAADDETRQDVYNSNNSRHSSSPQATTEDDSYSMTSSNGSANIVGKWWFGKNTRYVLHCDKKGCSHKGNEPAKIGDYLTPTQRKNKEISLLTRQLKRCETELEEKNKQLTQLRERLKEIEWMMNSNQALSENVRLLQRQSEREAEFRVEKEQLIQRHEIRVRQLIQETVDARTEMLKKAQQLERLKTELEIEKVEQACMTDENTFPSPVPTNTTTSANLSPVAAAGDEFLLRNEKKLSTISLREDHAASVARAIEEGAEDYLKLASPQSEVSAVSSVAANSIFNMSQQLQIALTQLEAYRNEALIWRTKAAQLEIVLKEFVANDANDSIDDEHNVNEETEAQIAGASRVSADEQKEMSREKTKFPGEFQRKITKSMSATNLSSSFADIVKQASMKFKSSASAAASKASSPAANAGECPNRNCVEQRRKLTEENKSLQEKSDERSHRVDELEDTLMELRSKHETRRTQLASLEALHAELGQLAESRLAEAAAAQMSLARLQLERANLNKAISYLESRCQVFQNVILDNNLVVRDDGGDASAIIRVQLRGESGTPGVSAKRKIKSANEKLFAKKTTNADEFKLTDSSTNEEDESETDELKTAELRRGFLDPDYAVYFSKSAQTELTSTNLDTASEEFNVLQRKLKEVEMEFSMERRKSAEILADAQTSLHFKSELVAQLTAQMHQFVQREKELSEQHQHERDAYRKKMEELGKIAERVPIIESEIDMALKAKSQLELAFRRAEHNFEDQMEAALADALTQRTESDAMWSQRLIVAEDARRKVQACLEKLQRDLCEIKLKHSVEKADLEERLTSSIKHVTELNNRLNCPKRDVECEAKPKVTNKYVACRPSVRHKSTELVKGDLPEDPELLECKAKLSQQTRKLMFTLDKLRRLEVKLLDAFETAKHTQNSSQSTRNSERVTFRRANDDVCISLRDERDMHNRRYDAHLRNKRISVSGDEDEISIMSAPAALAGTQKIRELEYGEKIPPQELNNVSKFAAERSDEVKRLKMDNERFMGEIHALKERLFKLENEAYEKSKDKVSHVSYLIPTKLDYDSCDNIELAVEISGVKKPPLPPEKPNTITNDERMHSLPPQRDVIADIQLRRHIRASSLSAQEIVGENGCTNASTFAKKEEKKLEAEGKAQVKINEPCDSHEIDESKRRLHQNLLTSATAEILQPNRNKYDRFPFSSIGAFMSAKPYFLSTKWDFERNVLVQRNTYLSEKLLRLKHKFESALSAGKLEESIARDNVTHNTSEKDPILLLEETCVELDAMLKNNKMPANGISGEKQRFSATEQHLTDEGEHLREERETLRKRLHDAEMELEIYRMEPLNEAHNILLSRSQSETELSRPADSASATSIELSRWKEMAGVMFRELNYLRNAFDASETQRLELKTQCAMLRGEIELAKCQNALAKEIALSRRKRRTSLDSKNEDETDKRPVQRKNSLGLIEPLTVDLWQFGNDAKRAVPLARLGSLNSTSIPNLSELIENIVRGENCTADKANGKLAKNNGVLGSEETLRKELAIIREAFHKQVSSLRATNQNLTQRVGDLEVKVDENLSREQLNMAKQERIDELETQTATLESECAILKAENEMYEKKISDIEEEHQRMYMVMFRKGQQAAHVEIQDDVQLDQMTEDRVMLKFLHDAFYYYLMNKGNSREHLQAIMTMLNFSNAQKAEIYQRRGKSH